MIAIWVSGLFLRTKKAKHILNGNHGVGNAFYSKGAKDRKTALGLLSKKKMQKKPTTKQVLC